jgi:hypothetical protein
MIQRLGHQVGECAKERVGNSVALRPVDRPSQRVDHHLPDQRRHREDARAVTAVGHQPAVEHHRHRPHIWVHRRLVLKVGRDPGRLRLYAEKQLAKA